MGKLGARVEPFQSSELDPTAIVAALQAEALYQRVWLPPEPWWPALVSEKEAVAEALHRRLARGGAWPRSAVVDVRKPGHGVRPVALMSPEVRVLYRAFVSAVVPVDQRADRSAERYAEFVLSPIVSAYSSAHGLIRVGDAKYSHVLVADLSAFYQYIDHTILRDELDLAGAGLELIDGLIALLGDIEGRSFGLPQRSESSDWLSEFYAARIERQLVRDGFDVWRYSDDFRVGCYSYGEALGAIESLSRAARDVGLVLNDQKTATPSFLTYLTHNAIVEIHDVSAEIDPSDVEAAVSGEYAPLDDEQAVEEATLTIDSLWDPENGQEPADDQPDLRELTTEQHRAVRRALNTLTKHSDASALSKLLSILAFQPAMTHLVVRYAEAMATERHDAVGAFLDQVISRLSLNEWQRGWVAYGFRSCHVPIPEESRQAQWLRSQLVDKPNSLPAAEAAVSLAQAGLVSLPLLESQLRTVSADFSSWYLEAIAVLNRAGKLKQSEAAAIRQSSAIAHAILK